MLQPPKVSPQIGWLIKKSGLSWWQVVYTNGKVVSEWETATGVVNFIPNSRASKTSRWEEIPKVGIAGVYLLCPDGNAHAIEANGEYSVFQLKVGVFSMGQGGASQNCDAHIIGAVKSSGGSCICWAWEYVEKRAIRFEDNVTHLAYRNIGPLSLGHHTGVR